MFHVIFLYIPTDDIVYIGIDKDHQNFNVTILICLSAFGYVPHYDPEAGHFGCLTNNTQLITHLFTIMVCVNCFAIEHLCYHNYYNYRNSTVQLMTALMLSSSVMLVINCF